MMWRCWTGAGASFGHGGLIQPQAMNLRVFSQSLLEIRRNAGNRAVDLHYHLGALPGFATPLLKYWWNLAAAGREHGPHSLDGRATLPAAHSTRHLLYAASAKRLVRL